ncbi:MAG: ArsC family transcriptional regulator, partial [Spirochaetaceae bacterium]|nr:ArsC family transcriptional regulator [Spirochaetaceae bacterium]
CLAKACGSRMDAIEELIDKNAKDYASIAYLEDSAKTQKLLDNPMLLKQPIVRNGKTAATVGYCPEVWEGWK